MIEIDSPEQLESWLRDKPPEWSAVILLRIALRMMPTVSSLGKYNNLGDLLAVIICVFRCYLISWACCNIQNSDATTTRIRIHAALDAADAATRLNVGMSVRTVVSIAADAVRMAIASSTFRDAAAVSANVVAIAAANAIGNVADRAAADARYTHRSAADASADASADMWAAISFDCSTFFNSAYYSEPVKGLLAKPLWPVGQPIWFTSDWQAAQIPLKNIQNLRNWYSRRVDGEAGGFDLSYEADAEIGRRLMDSDNGWWHEPTEVDSDIEAWLDDLATQLNSHENDFTQNPYALVFGADAEGQIDLLPNLAGDRILNDADGRDRHTEARTEAIKALAASSRDLTQAFAIGETISDYLTALGDSVETIRPSQLVLRGDKLRRLRADYIAPTSSKPPFTEDQAFALENWERAHSALVGIDPFLSSIERASYGPAVPATIITLDAIKAIIDSARDANIATAAAQTAITDSVENVPAEAPAGERRLVLATESLKNFIRGTAGFIKQHKGKISAGAVGLAKGAHEAALWIQRNIEWLRDALAGEQSILDLINWIASLPL